ncbi:hypothetical protein ACHQM5_005853 [Ranunculus cassubicifolius]
MVAKSSPLVTFLLLLVILISTTSVHCKPTENFLNHLEGCHKGQNVKGVHKVKQYLKKFGYLHYGDHSTHANDDEFDNLLESAIKTYQLNYHLKQTGTLNSETLNKIIRPRCGFPDIINDTTRMHSGKKFQHGPLSLHTVSHYSFFLGPSGPRRWRKTDLTYRFNSTVEVIDLPTLRPVISRAFAKWSAVTRFTFTEAQDGATSDIEIGFHRLNHGDNDPFDGEGDQTGNTLAHAYAPEIGLFHYDADESWSTNPSPTQFDLETIAVHEIGHLLGLRHSKFTDAIMWTEIRPGETKTELTNDDVQGIRTLYGLSP